MKPSPEEFMPGDQIDNYSSQWRWLHIHHGTGCTVMTITPFFCKFCVTWFAFSVHWYHSVRVQWAVTWELGFTWRRFSKALLKPERSSNNEEEEREREQKGNTPEKLFWEVRLTSPAYLTLVISDSHLKKNI